ncbi:MAG: hypothetical protein IKI50_02380 [Clostridia bacterium]|nr:hypothetical protein [Clostridia bacterium]
MQRRQQLLRTAADTVSNGLYTVLAGGTDVRDFGAVGDGKADDTAALQQAAEQGGSLYFPAGTYRVTGRLVVEPDTVLVFAPGALLRIEGNGFYCTGTVQAGLYQVFDGRVRGIPLNTEAYPQWFGAVGDGVTDDTAAFAQAVKLFGRVCVPYTENGYVVGELSLAAWHTLCGVGSRQPVLKAAAGVSRWITPVTGVRVHDLTLDMSAAADDAVCLYFHTAAGGMDQQRFYNLNILSPGTAAADDDTGNRSLVGNVHFDNIQITAPRTGGFAMTDFFGFVFLRRVTVDFQGRRAVQPGVYVKTNYGMILEDCTVCHSAAGSAPAFSLNDSWAIWTNRCAARDVGGTGFAAAGLLHCYLFGCTAEQTAGEGFSLGSIYSQASGLTARQTAGVTLHDGYYLTFSHIETQDGGVQLQNVRVSALHDVACSGDGAQIRAADGDFLMLADVRAADVSLAGKHSAVLP